MPLPLKLCLRGYASTEQRNEEDKKGQRQVQKGVKDTATCNRRYGVLVAEFPLHKKHILYKCIKKPML